MPWVRAISLLAVTAAAGAASGQTLTWIGGMADFGNPTSWDPTMSPVGRAVFIEDGTPNLDFFYTVSRATFGGAAGSGPTLTATDGSRALAIDGVTIINGLTLGPNASIDARASVQSNGGLAISGTSTLSVAGNFEIGGSISNSGMVSIGGDARLFDQSTLVGGDVRIEGTLSLENGSATMTTVSSELELAGGGVSLVSGSATLSGGVTARDATISATGSGILRLDGAFTATSFFPASDGAIRITGPSSFVPPTTFAAGAKTFLDGGTHTFAGGAVGGSVEATNATLFLDASGGTTFDGTLTIDNSTFSGIARVPSGGVLAVTSGRFLNFSTNAQLRSSGGTLRFDGGATMAANSQLSCIGGRIELLGSITGDNNTDVIVRGSATLLLPDSATLRASTIGSTRADIDAVVDVGANRFLAFAGRLLQFDLETLSGGTWIVNDGGRVRLSPDPNDRLREIGPFATVRLEGSGRIDELDAAVATSGAFELADGEFSLDTIDIMPGGAFEATDAMIRNGVRIVFSGDLATVTRSQIEASEKVEIRDGATSITDSTIVTPQVDQSGGTVELRSTTFAPTGARYNVTTSPAPIPSTLGLSCSVAGLGELNVPALGAGEAPFRVNIGAADRAGDCSSVYGVGATTIGAGHTCAIGDTEGAHQSGQGQTPATIVLDGDLTLAPGATFLTRLAPAPDRLVITGVADLAANLVISLDPVAPPPPGAYVLVQIDQTLLREFANVTPGAVVAEFACGAQATYANDLGDGNDLGVVVSDGIGANLPPTPVAFLVLLESGDLAADLTGDGHLDVFDLIEYLKLESRGCVH